MFVFLIFVPFAGHSIYYTISTSDKTYLQGGVKVNSEQMKNANFPAILRLAWWKMTIRRQDSAHIFSVAESFSNYSQDQDPMSSFVIGSKITVLMYKMLWSWCSWWWWWWWWWRWWGCEAMIFRANDKIGMEARGCFRAVPLTAGASTDDSKVSPLPSPFLLTHRAPPL